MDFVMFIFYWGALLVVLAMLHFQQLEYMEELANKTTDHQDRYYRNQMDRLTALEKLVSVAIVQPNAAPKQKQLKPIVRKMQIQ